MEILGYTCPIYLPVELCMGTQETIARFEDKMTHARLQIKSRVGVWRLNMKRGRLCRKHFHM